MKKTFIAMFTLALAFVFAGTAMAYKGQLRTKCPETTYGEHLLTFPYMPGATEDGWWQVFSVTNKNGAAIPYSELCMAGVLKKDTPYENPATGNVVDPQIFALDETWQYTFPTTGSIPGNGIIADALTPAKPGIYALYGKTATTADADVKGFAMFGNTMAHGYFAVNKPLVFANSTTTNSTVLPSPEGSTFLEFDYYPNEVEPWMTGMAVTHNSTADVKLTFTFHYATGTKIAADKVLKKDQILWGSVGDLFPEVGTNTRARVQVTHNATRNSVGLQGFIFFGDETHGMGYLGNPVEVMNATGVFNPVPRL